MRIWEAQTKFNNWKGTYYGIIRTVDKFACLRVVWRILYGIIYQDICIYKHHHLLFPSHPVLISLSAWSDERFSLTLKVILLFRLSLGFILFQRCWLMISEIFFVLPYFSMDCLTISPYISSSRLMVVLAMIMTRYTI